MAAFRRSTTLATQNPDPRAGRVTTVPWAVAANRNAAGEKYWVEADKAVLKKNLRAAWGLKPKGHPSSKTYTPRTALQKR